LSKNIHFKVSDYDFLNNINNSFNWIFSIYSIYYSADSQALIEKLKNAISPGGKFVIIGPGSNNGVDLDNFNLKVTGVLPNQEHIVRTKRIESEFYPLFKRIFGEDNTSLEIVDTEMSFPTIDDFEEYYWSTLLWRDSIEDLSTESIQTLKDKTLAILSGNKGF
jgi:SAM-dependent methyltransferase